MGRYLTAGSFLLLFCAVIYLGAIVTAQQRAIEALVSDQTVTMQLQDKLVKDIQSLRQEIHTNK